MNKTSQAVKIEDLSYKYSNDAGWVLKNINLEVPRGSFYVLIGPSGSGKTTLLSLVRGFYQEIGGEFQGKINVLGKNVNQVTIGELGETMGIVFQNPALQLHQLRVIDEVASAPMYRGLSYDECQRRASVLVDRILGKDFYYRSPSELSAGQQQKVALAASLSLDAEVLLLDEPFSFLDERSDQELVKLLVGLYKEGKTIIVSTHDVAQISNVATQIGVMNRGELIFNGLPKDVLCSTTLRAIMPPPLFVEAAKTAKIDGCPLSWNELTPQLAVGKTKPKKYFKMENKVKLSLRNLSFRYPDSNHGVKGINLDIYEGEIFGLIGTNGSGKTTIARLITGLLIPQKGEVCLGEENITHVAVYEKAKKIGYLTQDPLDMFFESTLLDEVAAGPKFLKLSDPNSLAEKTLKQFNLWQYKNRHPDSISGGEKSKLGMADILANDTEILLLDEPEFGLDPKSWGEVEDVLKKLKQSEKTVIVITQDLEAAFFLCDRVAVMKEGFVLKVGPTIEIFKNQSLFFEAGLPVLPFYPLIKDFSNDVELTKGDFLGYLKKKE